MAVPDPVDRLVSDWARARDSCIDLSAMVAQEIAETATRSASTESSTTEPFWMTSR